MVGLESYDSGAKETWRGWQWNRIVERLIGTRRLSDKEKRLELAKKTVLYLCGPDDHDRTVALRHGFRSENLIAVDICSDNIAKVRKHGGIGIVSRLEQVVDGWSGVHIDAIVADTCSGFDNAAFDLEQSMMRSKAVSHETVVSINLKRGRDPGSNHFRDLLKVHWSSNGRDKIMQSGFVGCAPDRELSAINEAWSHIDGETLHRGKLWWFYHTGLHESIGEIWNSSRPVFYSYRTVTDSSVTVMDSCVYLAVLHTGIEKWREWSRNVEMPWKASPNKKHNPQVVKQKVAAAKAVRTMKARK
jgi:hypothetical protein